MECDCFVQVYEGFGARLSMACDTGTLVDGRPASIAFLYQTNLTP